MKHLAVILVVALLLITVGAAPVAAAPAPGFLACGSVYIVRSGDTLANIAFHCGTTVGAILAANPTIVNPNRIYAGQRLNMPGGAPPPVPGTTQYVVKRGDTMLSIARHFGTTVSAILKVNPGIKNPNSIFAGQVIRVPSGSTNPPTFTSVKIPLIDLQDAGGPAGPVGCGDRLVMVTRNVPATTAPLTAAVTQLLSLHERMYGQTGLYNPLYQSSLAVQSVTVNNGLAVIRLTGKLSLGGECDDPRVSAMFDAIGRQFSTVQRVQVYINGKTLESLLGGRGS